MIEYDAYIFDLDGTVYLGEALLPNAGETIIRLRNRGKRTVFLSNNPTKTRQEYAQKLTRLGLPTPDGEYVVLEVNAVPGWRALAPTTGIDVAREIIAYCTR